LQGSAGPLDARHLAATEDDLRQARQAFAACSLDAPLSPGDDPAALADLLGEDDPAVSHATDIKPSAPTWTSCPNANSAS
jgi:hypothetical protein